MLGRVSIRVLLPLLMGLPVAVAAVVLVTLWSGQTSETARTLNAAEMAQIHGRIDERLASLLETLPRATRIQRGHILAGRRDRDDLRSWRGPLFEFAEAMDMISGISWGDATGRATWVFRYPGKLHPEFAIADEQTKLANDSPDTGYVEEYSLDATGNVIDRIGGYPYDPRGRPWYVGAVLGGKPTYLDPYAWLNVDGQATTLGLPFVEPVYIEPNGDGEERELIGVLAAEFSLEDLAAFLRTLEVGDAGFVLILDGGGRLIAHSLPKDQVPAIIEIDGLPAVPVASQMADARVRDAANHVAREVARQQGERAEDLSEEIESGTIVADIAGSPMLVRVSAYHDAPGLDWRIITALPEAELLLPVAAARASSDRASTAAFVLTVLLGLALGLLATRPVSRLVREIGRVGEGELEERVVPGVTSELGRIAEAVNTMAEDLRDRVRLRESLLVAMEVQKNLLPHEPPVIEGLDIAGHSTYCDETGGDYYDYLHIEGLSERCAALAIGDVVGHGVAAAMLMATARGILRSRCHEPASLGELLKHLNELLVDDTGGERFMTMLLVVLDGGTGNMAWASAGHGPPMVYVAKDDRFAEHKGGGIPLGLFAGREFETYTAGPFSPGDIVVLSTDGLWEAKQADGEFYGMERLQRVIRESATENAESIAAAIREDHKAACGDKSQDDDITFVVAKIV
ncbi:MAG: SpoIIE family protein phosphatase [Phycisphaera sp.]|nr:MAG: SpoIIE family protein phosphatase [Phycisphaera sp.]